MHGDSAVYLWLAQSGYSYRSNALLLPVVSLFRYLSRPVLVGVVLLSAPIAYVVTTQVLTGQLL